MKNYILIAGLFLLLASHSYAAQPFELPQGKPSDFGLKEGDNNGFYL